MYELRTGYWILGRRETEPSACVRVSLLCSAGKWPQWSLKLNTLLLLLVFIVVVTIIVPGQQSYTGKMEQNMLQMEGNFKKKKKYILQINLRARNGPPGRLANHSDLESLRQFAEV